MSRLRYYALPNRLTKAVNINLTFRNILPYILFIFLIIIPIIEIYITEIELYFSYEYKYSRLVYYKKYFNYDVNIYYVCLFIMQ